MRNCEHEIRAVHGIEVKILDPVLEQFLHLSGGDSGRHEFAGFGIVIETVEFLCQPIGQRRAGTTVPAWLAEKFDGLDDDADTRKLVAATVAAGQVQKLAKHGVDTFHFYTMNRADLVFAISHLLGIRPSGTQKAA